MYVFSRHQDKLKRIKNSDLSPLRPLTQWTLENRLSYRMASYREALSKLPQGHDPEEFRLIRVNSPPRIIMGQYLHLTFIELTGDFWAAGAYEVDKGWTINENDYMESSRFVCNRIPSTRSGCLSLIHELRLTSRILARPLGQSGGRRWRMKIRGIE